MEELVPVQSQHLSEVGCQRWQAGQGRRGP